MWNWKIHQNVYWRPRTWIIFSIGELRIAVISEHAFGTPCLFLAIIKERYEENFGYQYMCNSPAAPSPQSRISGPFSWAIIHSPRPILRLIRWCSIRRVLWWPEQPSSAKSFHLTHPMWLWYMRMTYSCSDAQGGSGIAESSKKNAQSTRLGELHIWGTPPLTRSFIMAENRQGAYQACSQMKDTARIDQKPRKWSVNPQYKLV